MSPKLPLAPPPPLPKLPHCWPAVPRPSAISMSPRGPAPAALPSAAPSQRRTHLPAPIANPSYNMSLQGRAPSAACRSMTLLQLLVSISISDAWI
ncbi:early nodulin-20-like isoform X2 [Sorghum bicolor]|uniref:early nodulin-20-like isoform X2 n=1 Tax=Sorghum bicolor TaxID=4558 RepID=UPI00081AD65C|nr:early nodulin-20-like isoform X2 [Sorghum bicolor]|eukprot:XP_021318207.1 early nodulin-20-like isoform X2 [Sorghum bicolor]